LSITPVYSVIKGERRRAFSLGRTPSKRDGVGEGKKGVWKGRVVVDPRSLGSGGFVWGAGFVIGRAGCDFRASQELTGNSGASISS